MAADGQGRLSRLKKPLSTLVEARRNLRRRINQRITLDRALHLFICFVFAANIAIIVYALGSIIGRGIISNVPLLDALPLAFYVLPLMVILPKLLLDLYRARLALVNILILSISATVFGLISPLVRGFAVLVILNLVAGVFLFVMGRFRSTRPIRKIGKRGIAWFLLLNILGLAMPVSVVVMGQNPIAEVDKDPTIEIFLEMPLGYDISSEMFPEDNLTSALAQSGFGVDLHLLANNTQSILRFQQWVTALDNQSVPFRITISSNKSMVLDSLSAQSLPYLTVFDVMADQYSSTLAEVSNITESMGVPSTDIDIFFDMSLSVDEWEDMMGYVRSVELAGFSSYLRNQTENLNQSQLYQSYRTIDASSQDLGFRYGFVVDGFSVDDMLDNDATVSKLNGFTSLILQEYDPIIEVDCSRSRYSKVMDGDVGEYLPYTYSLPSRIHSMRLGTVGNQSGHGTVEEPVYQSLNAVVTDIVIASGNGVSQVVISSLPSIITSFGIDGISGLRTEFDAMDSAEVTYTFRIYAFRSVIAAIDSFDFIML